jgi:hypothetical protein
MKLYVLALDRIFAGIEKEEEKLVEQKQKESKAAAAAIPVPCVKRKPEEKPEENSPKPEDL